MRAFARAASVFLSDLTEPPSLAISRLCSRSVLSAPILVQTVDFPLDVPDCLAQILHGVSLIASPPKVLDGVADAEVMVLGDGDALNTRRVPGVVRGMVYWVGWLLHPCTLPNPAWLSSVRFSHKSQVPLFQGAT